MSNSCTQMRRQLITHSTVNLTTGEYTDGAQEWKTQPCGVPLFSDADRTRGTCRSCAKGWTHPNNYPVTQS